MIVTIKNTKTGAVRQVEETEFLNSQFYRSTRTWSVVPASQAAALQVERPVAKRKKSEDWPPEPQPTENDD